MQLGSAYQLFHSIQIRLEAIYVRIPNIVDKS